jgi:hypothetical protein
MIEKIKQVIKELFEGKSLTADYVSDIATFGTSESRKSIIERNISKINRMILYKAENASKNLAIDITRYDYPIIDDIRQYYHDRGFKTYIINKNEVIQSSGEEINTTLDLDSDILLISWKIN